MKTILEREDVPLHRIADQLEMLVAEATEQRRLRETTQPELLMMGSAVSDSRSVEEPAQPPSLLRILIELRRPEARRGLDRFVKLLERLGAVDPESQYEKGGSE